MLAAFLAGLLVFWGAIWLTNGIRDERNSSEQASQSLERRRAGTAWQSMIGTELGKIGGQHELGSPPIVFPQMRSTLADLANGTPEDAAASLRQIATQSKAMADAVQKYALSESLADKGFDKGSVLRFLSARDELTTAMTLFREAALLGAAATKLDPKDRAEVLGRAQSLVVQAQAALHRFETHQIEALSAAGIHPTNPALPGLPGS